MRRLIAFDCAGETLAGTLDEAGGTTGLLIVSGGSEIRIGAHRGMALMAQAIAAAGHPVMRFDRRGIGDSTGHDRGFESSADDIAAALTAFRAKMPQLQRVIAFGNCDAASALALHAPAGLDGLVLANPWVIEAAADDALPPAAAIRARYAERLRDPRAWWRLLRGGVDLGKLARGLRKAAAPPPAAPQGLAARVASGIAAATCPITVLMARRDNTAIAFAEAWAGDAFAPTRERATLYECETDSHSFHRAQDRAWLLERLSAALG
ncbi:hydrolase 1, exosortase A system-associated [Sphingomonas baiyangensis]|uniref:Hydrolase 1, exosortase A system-associated n=1 Tax=Sphingomonas baiyangensis TaxID=2572576 RepID=A0A4U1L241_9SPHN|nr:hydrolase 1, exosortase A system-associated [Sphingomonas baiyangensis]TKD50931.1 hydrolase 1, exosortase A system-associated [Sphingomonas baiyangensis]